MAEASKYFTMLHKQTDRNQAHTLAHTLGHTPVHAYSHLQIDNRPNSSHPSPAAAAAAGQSPGQLIRLPANHASQPLCAEMAERVPHAIDNCVPASVFLPLPSLPPLPPLPHLRVTVPCVL